MEVIVAAIVAAVAGATVVTSAGTFLVGVVWLVALATAVGIVITVPTGEGSGWLSSRLQLMSRKSNSNNGIR
jgi:hypothetical protein